MKTDTLIRTIVLAVALLNQILSATGKSILPIEDETVSQLITAAFTIITSLAAWWKNNSFSPEAIEADVYLESLRKNGIKQ